MRLRLMRACSVLLTFTALACTSDPAPTIEPITDSGTEAAPTTDEAIAAEAPFTSEPPLATEEDTPCSLTDDPYGAPEPPQNNGTDTPAASETAPEVIDDYGGAFESDLEGAASDSLPAPGTNVATPGTKNGKSAKPGKSSKGRKKVFRYVNATLLNVRGKPSPRAPIVRRLLGGAKVEVELHGRFAKIRNGQWCHAKFLSDTPTKKVSRAEVEQAWKNSKVKDRWKPKKK